MENTVFCFCGITDDRNGTGCKKVIANEIRIYRVDLSKTKEIIELFDNSYGSLTNFINEHYTEEKINNHGYTLNTLLYLVEKELGLTTVKLPCNIAHTVKLEFEF